MLGHQVERTSCLGGTQVAPVKAEHQRIDTEAAIALQALKEQFPDRYRELLEQYNKALAEGKRVTEPAGDR